MQLATGKIAAPKSADAYLASTLDGESARLAWSDAPDQFD